VGTGSTLNAGASSASNSLAAVSGSDLVIGGSGDDTIIAGVNDDGASIHGVTTLTGGAGANLFFFSVGSVNGQDIITDFTSNDTFFMNNYDTLAGGAAGSNTAATQALANAVSSGGNVTLTLQDGTKVTFDNTTVAALTGHVVST